MQADPTQRIPRRSVAALVGREHGRRSTRVPIRLGLVDGSRLRDVERHLQDGRPFI